MKILANFFVKHILLKLLAVVFALAVVIVIAVAHTPSQPDTQTEAVAAVSFEAPAAPSDAA